MVLATCSISKAAQWSPHEGALSHVRPRPDMSLDVGKALNHIKQQQVPVQL